MPPSIIACIALLSIAVTLAMIVICKRPSLRVTTVLLSVVAAFSVYITIPNIYWMSYRAYPSELAIVFALVAASWVIFPKKIWSQWSGVITALTLSWLCGKAFCSAHAGSEYSGREQVTLPANKVTMRNLSSEIHTIILLSSSDKKVMTGDIDETHFPLLKEAPPKKLAAGWLRNCGVEAFETVAHRAEQNTIYPEFDAIPLWHSWLTGLYKSEYYQPGVWTPGGELEEAINQLELRPDPNLPLLYDRLRFVQ